MNDSTREISLETLRAAREGDPVVVATVIIAPESGAVAPAGTKLLVRPNGSRLGSFGGEVRQARKQGQ